MIAIRFDHFAITVSQMDRSLEFYCDFLGLIQQSSHDLAGTSISKMAGKDKVRMRVVRLICPENPHLQVDLQEYLEPHGKQSDSNLGDIANSHLCIEVDDLDQAYADLKSKGAEFVSPPVEFDLEAEGKIGCVFLKDPDGYVLELSEYRK